MAVIAVIQDLMRLLVRDELTVSDVIDAVGAVVSDPGVPMPMELKPTASGIHAASLARYPDTGSPYVVTLVPEPAARPTIGELNAAFGPHHVGRHDRGFPVPLVFDPVSAGGRCSVVLIADLPPRSVDTASARAERISLRRDVSGAHS